MAATRVHSRLLPGGVYLIRGGDAASVARRWGEIQARTHPVALFTAFAAVRGRLAAVYGPGPRRDGTPSHLAWDLDAHRFRFLVHGRRLWRRLREPVRTWVEAFASGIEAVRRECRRRPPPHAPPALWGRLVARPVTPALVCALDYRLACHHELARLRGLLRADTSNAVAVGAGRARGGGAYLLLDPHLPFEAVPELRLLAVRLEAPGYRAAGLGRLGSPFVFVGFSRHLAWTVTTNWPDTLRYYVLRRTGDQYRCGTRRWRRLERRVRVPVAGGRQRTFSLTFAGHLDRPVLQGLPGGRALAVTLAATRAGDLSTQLFTAARVRTAAAFRRRVLAVPGAALTNFIVADRAGGIGCFWHGLVPTGERGYLDPVREMPADDGREEGLLVQNNAHFARVRRAAAVRPEDFPPRVSGGGKAATSFRQERTLRLLGPLRRIGLPDLMGAATDERDLQSRLFLSRALPCLPRRLGPAAREARDLLARWSGHLGARSRPGTLAQLWFELAARSWPPLRQLFERPDDVPPELPAPAREACRRAFREALSRWRAAGRPAWGRVHYRLCGGVRLPVGGSAHTNWAAGWLSPPDLDPETLHFPVEAGSVCPMIVHLTARGVRAWFLKATGPMEVPEEAAVAAARAWARKCWRLFPL